jgi:hypothetical protein
MIKRIILSAIKFYQKIFSSDHGILKRLHKGCRFYPSCSEYAYQAIKKHGVLKGSAKSAKRIIKCHPWNEGGYDPLET